MTGSAEDRLVFDSTVWWLCGWRQSGGGGGGGRLKHEGEYAWLMSQRILSDGGSGKVIIQGAIVSRLASGLTYLTYWGRGGGIPTTNTQPADGRVSRDLGKPYHMDQSLTQLV